MNTIRLVLRTLVYYRLSGIAVAGAAAVASAVLGGALLMGGALPASLELLVDLRLGPVDQVVSGARPFPAALGERLAGAVAVDGSVQAWPAWIVGGSCRGKAGASVGRVQVLAAALPGLAAEPGTCLLGAELAGRLRAAVGDEIEVWVGEAGGGGASPLPRGLSQPRALRLRVARVAGEREVGSLFSLEAEQRPPRNCWVDREELARLLERPGAATHLLVQGKAPLERALGRALRLSDAGYKLRLAAEERVVVLESESLVLPEALIDAARGIAAGDGNQVQVVAANLAGSVARAGLPGRPGRAAPYVMIAGLDPFPLGQEGVLLSEWAARDLEAIPGDRIELRYYARQAWGGLAENEAVLPLLGVRPMQGPWADPSLTPELPGLTDAAAVREWDPPAELGLDLGRIRPIDEEFWERHRAAPRVFMPMSTAVRLWGGAVTSLRVRAVEGARLEQALLATLAPEDLGVRCRPVRAEQRRAAAGTTDFGLLFLGFSFFLLIAAGLLVGLLFRLAVIGRADQLGLLQALGFGRGRTLLFEATTGGALALVGSLAGMPLALGYAALMVFGLNHWWREALGSGFVVFVFESSPLVVGAAGSFLLALCGVAWAVLGLTRIPPGRLLAGETAAEVRPGRGGRAGWTALVLLAGALFLVVSGWGLGAAFFGAGALLLAAGLAGLAAFLGRTSRKPVGLGAFPLLRLALAGAGRNPGRSLIAAGLVATAAFVLVTVAAHRGGTRFDPLARRGPSGGYTLVAEARPPLPADPGSREGRELLALSEEPWWERVEVAALRLSPGADLSCLNLYRGDAPRLAAIPREWAEGEPRFRFVETLWEAANPWTLLEQTLPGGEIPAVADAETARWTLHVPLGGTVEARDGAGRRVRLRLVGLLAKSLFQGELLVGETHFRRLFPELAGFGRLLIQAGPEEQPLVAESLSRQLVEHGLEVEPVGSLMAAYTRVADTYMAAFAALGGLGLLLGGAGLVVALLRSLAERRDELALLACLGFGRRKILMLLAAEHGFLYLAGLLIGALMGTYLTT